MKSDVKVIDSKVLNLWRIESIIAEIIFIGIAILIPVLLHNVFNIHAMQMILPMHWTIILAGLIYGWKGGLIAGATTPTLSFLMTGSPLLPMLPLMSVELALYGLITGLLREKLKLNAFLSVFIALIVGRIGYLAAAVALSRLGDSTLVDFAIVKLSPGLISGGIQIVALPLLAMGFINLFGKNSK